MPTPTPTPTPSTSALTMSLTGPRLSHAVQGDDDWPSFYAIGSLLQLAPGRVALVANRRVTGEQIVDFENGADVMVLDRLDAIAPEARLPVMRNERAAHPRTGEPLIMVTFVATGGFVPLSARLADGRPHPAAGTGFLLGMAMGVPADGGDGKPPRADAHRYHEIIQLAYDGEQLRVTRTDRFNDNELLPGMRVINRGMSNAIPDGADLLYGLVAGPAAASSAASSAAGGGDGLKLPCDHPHADPVLGRNFGSGMSRWRYDAARGWRPVAFTPVTGADMSFEPTLRRDVDGSLLCAVRGKGVDAPPGAVVDGLENTHEHLRVSRSTDGGATWHRVLHEPLMRTPTPAALNQTAGGRPFLCGNPYLPRQHDARGRLLPPGRQRQRLCMWPITEDRRGVGEAVGALDAVQRFGAAQSWEGGNLRHDNLWLVDHPIGEVVQLGDGAWHALVCFRVSDAALHAGGAPPTEAHGLWIETVEAPNETPRPAWTFE